MTDEDFTGGLELERKTMTWKIKNFDVIKDIGDLISAQKIQFQAGSTIGLPTKWSMYLKPFESVGTKWISVFIRLLEKPENVKNVTAKYILEIETPPNYARRLGTYTKFDTGTSSFNEKGWGFNKLFDRGSPNSILLLTNGTLSLKVDFTLYAPARQTWDTIQEKAFESKSVEQLSRDFIDNFSDLTSSDVLLVSKDKVEVPSNRRILSARSSVFRAMFESQMMEAETGKVEIDDLSGESLQVLNKYLCTGKLDPKWKSDVILEEMIYGADKYDLVHLIEFLNENLDKVCSKENAKVLVILASRFGMKKAEQGLIDYMKKYAITADDITIVDKGDGGDDKTICGEGDGQPARKRFKFW